MSDNDPGQQPQQPAPDLSLSKPALPQPQPQPPAEQLPPGAGSPLVPGPPMSVREPMKDTTLNQGALLMFGGIAVLIIIVVAILFAVLHH